MAGETRLGSRDEFGAWLKGKDLDWARVLAVRAALRVLPLAGGVFAPDRLDIGRKQGLIVATFRATSTAWLARTWPSHAIDATYHATNAANATNAAINATNVINIATIAANAAINAATNAANAAAAIYAAAATTATYAAAYAATIDATAVWDALSVDATELQSGTTVEELAIATLWQRGAPDWFAARHAELRTTLLADSSAWAAWLDWYDARVSGGFMRGLGKNGEEQIALKLIAQNEGWWDRSAAEVNAEIAGWVEEERERQRGAGDDVDNKEIVIPPLKPAALEPEWEDGVLRSQTASIERDVDAATADAAMSMLRSALERFSDDLSEENNVDRRFRSHFAELLREFPNRAPQTTEALFSLAHYGEMLSAYVATANAEWNGTIAAQFAAIALQYERTMKKFPAWRAFTTDPDAPSLTHGDVSAARDLTKTLATALEDNLRAEFVDQTIVDALHHLADAIPDVEPVATEDRFAAVEAQSRARDALESVNNVFKRIAEAALWVAAKASAIVKEGALKFAEGAAEQYPKSMKGLGEGFVKWSVKFAAIGLPTIAGGSVLVPWLATNFPTQFGWLNSVWDVLKTAM